MRTPAIALCCVAIPACWAGPAGAALLTYRGSVTVDYSDEPTAHVGDVWYFEFTYDDQTVDTDPDESVASLDAVLVGLTLAPDPGNTGTYDPSGATLVASLAHALDDFGHGPIDAVLFWPVMEGLPPLGGQDVVGIELGFRAYDLSLTSDNGSGQTVDQILGGPLPPDLSVYDYPTPPRLYLDNETISVIITAPITELILVPPCPWDCDGSDDGEIGIEDFLALLGQWGSPGSCDFDGSGDVGIEDFLEALGFWGPCPSP